MYDILSNSSCSWICDNCGMPNFTESFFNNTSELNLSNTFSILSESDESSFQIFNSDANLKASTPSKNNAKINTKPNKRVKGMQAKALKIMVINCCSIQSKRKQGLFHATIDSENPDIIFGTESHLSSDIYTAEAFPINYSIHRKDRNQNGGGVFVAVRNDFVCSEQPEFNTHLDLELVWSKIQIQGSKQLFLGSFYRPPKSTVDTLEWLGDSVRNIYKKYPNPWIILGGDFNLPDINWADGCIKQKSIYPTQLYHRIMDICNESSLTQVNEQTTRGKNILDVIFTTCPDLISDVHTIPGISDHDIVIATVNQKVPRTKKKPRTVYLYNKGDFKTLKHDISIFRESFMNSNPCNNTVEENWQSFKNKLQELTNKHIPQKTIRDRHDIPWMSRSIKRTIRKKGRLYNNAKKSNKPEDWVKFRAARKLVKKELAKAHDEYLSDLLNIPEHQPPKKFWNYIKQQRKDVIGIPPLKVGNEYISDSKQKADILNNQYQSVFTTDKMDDLPSIGSPLTTAMKDITITTKGVISQLQKLNTKKAIGPDMVLTRILKEAATEIAPILQFIFQQSLDTGELPFDWRTANINAIYKKGSKGDPANYRPISLTSVTCKILEHIIFSNVMSHLDQHNILMAYQHGFRKKHSCETQLTLMIDNLAEALDDKQQTDVLILDFSKAFDSISHRRLIFKLDHHGICGKTLGWIKTWLTNRTQKVVVDGETSNEISVQSGVPQGTVLGPLMFLLYINDIGNDIESNIRLFADDCLLYRVINCAQDAIDLQSDFQKLVNWADTWQMSFNPTKCHTLRVTNSTSPVLHDYTINGITLKDVKHEPYLGVELTHNLSWKHHIDKITMKANKSLGFVRRNLSQGSRKVKELAYFTLVRPHLEYACCVWDPYRQSHINQIEQVQRHAARFVTRDYRYTSSVTEMINNLGWQSLETRRQHRRLINFYKSIHGEIALPLPYYVKPNARQSRGHDTKFQHVKARIDSFSYSYFPRTIRNWNNIPQELVSSSSSSVFAAMLQAKK